MNLKLKKLNILLEFKVKNQLIINNNIHLILLKIIIKNNNIHIEVALIIMKMYKKNHIYNN